MDVGRGVLAGTVGTAVMALFMLANGRLAAFPDVDALLAAMAKDVSDTREILGM